MVHLLHDRFKGRLWRLINEWVIRGMEESSKEIESLFIEQRE